MQDDVALKIIYEFVGMVSSRKNDSKLILEIS